MAVFATALQAQGYYMLTVQPKDPGTGSVSPSGPREVHAGDAVSVSASPGPGYTFVRWLANGVECSTKTSFSYTMPEADVILEAEMSYNPLLPGDPEIDVQEQTETHSYTISYYPESLGSPYTSTCESGQRVYNSTNANIDGYRFVKWLLDGDSVSNNTSYTFTMPKHDVQLVKVFEYDPSLPGDPDIDVHEPTETHSYTISYYPESLGPSYTYTCESGQRVYNSTNANIDGYCFVKWLLDGDSVSNNTSYTFTMPKHDVQLVKVFKYDPSLPGNPIPNGLDWYGTEAELVIDDFTPGAVSSAATAKLGSTPAAAIKSIVVAGKVNENDFGLLGRFSACEWYDFSRTNLVKVNDACRNNKVVNHVFLPQTVEQVVQNAFQGCSSLTYLTCLATTPPTLGSNVFNGVPEDMTVYVHHASIPLYQAAEGWGNFTILPLREEVRNLEIHLPEGSEDGRCKNMTLEVVNAKSGVKNRYVVSDRITYVFEMLRRCTYNVYLRNHHGVIMSEVMGVDVINDPVSVTFGPLKPTYDVTLHVETPDGDDVTDQAAVTWLDKYGEFMGQDFTLDGMTEGTALTAKLTLGDALGADFMAPADFDYKVVGGDNSPVFTLQPFEMHKVRGLVVDAEDDMPLPNAAIIATQNMNGKYSRSRTASAGTTGWYEMNLANVPTTLTVSCDGHVSKTVKLDSITTAVLDTIKMEPIVTAYVMVKTNHTDVVLPGEESVTLSGYNDRDDLWFEVRDVTRDSLLTGVSQQLPLLVMPPVVEEGDELDITCHSHDGKFAPIHATATVGEGMFGEVMFTIVPYGQMEASFHSTDNNAVHGSLYDADGKLSRTDEYDETKLTFGNLPDGAYTLVTMGASTYYNTIYHLADLEALGLHEGLDYVSQSLSVESGKVTVVDIDHVPTFVDSHLYYTGENTSFKAGATRVKQGKTVTFTTLLDFKKLYEGKVSNVKLLYDFSSTARFVNGSVVKNNHVDDYLAGDGMLTVEGVESGDVVKFCLIPEGDGQLMATAMVEFDNEGHTIRQPIGMATVEVASLKLRIPEKTAVPSISVWLDDIPDGSFRCVEIYDNGHLVAKLDSLKSGKLPTYHGGIVAGAPRKIGNDDNHLMYENGGFVNNINCDLYDAYYYSWHRIQAKLISYDGKEYYTKTSTCQYDPMYLQLETYGLWSPPSGNGVSINNQIRTLSNKTYRVNNTTNVPIQFYAHFDYNPHLLDLIDQVNFLYHYNNKDGKRSFSKRRGRFGEGTGIIFQADNIIGSNQYGFFASDVFKFEYLPINMTIDVKMKPYDLPEDDTANNRFLKLLKAYIATNDSLVNVVNTLGEQINAELAKTSPNYDYVNTLLSEQTNSAARLWEGHSVTLTAQDYNNINAFANAASDVERRAIWENMKTNINTLPEYQQFEEQNNGYYTSNLTIPSTDLGNGLFTPTISYEVGNPATGNFIQDFSASNWHIDEAAMNSNPEVISFVNDGGDHFNYDFTGHLADYDPKSPLLAGLQSFLEGQVKSTLTDGVLGMFKDPITMKVYEGLIRNQTLAKSLVEKCPESAIAKLMLEEANVDKAMFMFKPGAQVAAALEKMASFVGALFTIDDILDSYTDLDKDWDAWEDLFDAAAYACKSGVDDGGAHQRAQRQRDEYRDNIIKNNGYRGGVGALGVIAKGATLILSAGTGSVVDGREQQLKNENMQNMRDFVDAINNTPGCSKITLKNPITEDFYATRLIDPSGYVYEAVSSNRLEGVTTTIYYKDSIQDAYGDWHKTVVLWDAENYNQHNPMYSDKNGKYGWDVPEGWWQVKYEKEGYETAYSEWLPVPPPQLDVNIGLVQRTVPEVKLAKAYLDGVEVTFDKYMDLETINTDNIHVKVVNGEEETLLDDCVITLLNEEPVTKGDTLSYASKLRIAPTNGWNGADEVVLIVSRQVKSYAGVKMQEDFVQYLDIDYRVREIVADTMVMMVVDSTATMRVGALPADASKGKVLNITCSSEGVLELNEQQVTLDENGEALLRMKGLMEGAILVNMAIEGEEAEGETMVRVLSVADLTVGRPYASRISGTEVYRGQTVTLESDTEGATIYYTTDGSCPCEDTPSRHLYDGTPIVIDQPMVIRAIAVKDGWFDSEATVLQYGIRQADMDIALGSGWNWISHRLMDDVDVTTLEGKASRVVSQVSEAVDDPVYGFVGNLQQMNAAECYKVNAPTSASLTLQGDEVDGGNMQIQLLEGWNWVGYPIGQVMSVKEALWPTDADEEDAIVGQEGFATFEDGMWSGTLNTLTPGKGYLYKARNDNVLIYDNSIVSVAAAQNRHNVPLDPAPWAVDRTKYPNTMNIIAQLYDDDTPVDEGEYHIGAFSDTECRGIGVYVNGLIYLTIYGNGEETIHFKAAECDNDRLHDVMETFDFEADVLGSRHQPVALHIGTPTKVRTAKGDQPKVWPRLTSDKLNVRFTDHDLQRVTLTSAGGETMMRQKADSDEFTLHIGSMPKGIYILTVEADGKTYYFKVVKK